MDTDLIVELLHSQLVTVILLALLPVAFFAGRISKRGKTGINPMKYRVASQSSQPINPPMKTPSTSPTATGTSATTPHSTTDKTSYLEIASQCLNKTLSLARLENDQMLQDGSHWEEVILQDSVLVHRLKNPNQSQETASVPCMKGVGVVPCSVPDLVKILSEKQNRKKWDPLVVESSPIEQISPDMSVEYTEFRGVWPVAGRDIVSLSYGVELEGGSFALVSQSIVHPNHPPRANLVRAQLLGGGFIIDPIECAPERPEFISSSPVSPSSNNNNTNTNTQWCRVTFIAHVDLGGKIPSALLNLLSIKQPMCVAKLRELVRPTAEITVKSLPPKREHLELHPLLKENEIFISAGVWDVLSAKLAQKAGFNSVIVNGYAVAATLLGEPDFGLLTQTEILDVARRICRAVSIPVIVDGDTGFGGPLNVIRMVKELVDMGARGILLEDQTWPKRCGHMRNKSVIPMEEHIQKIKAACDARGDAPFMITARTDARIISLDEALKRAKAYRAAGADFIFVEAPESVEEIRRISQELRGIPIVVNMLDGGKTPFLPLTDVHSLGFLSCGYVLTGLFASARATFDAFRYVVKEGSSRKEYANSEQGKRGQGLVELMGWDEFVNVVNLEEKMLLDEKYKA